VTNLSNGRQVIVRVNDRGPFVSDRLIDLSFAAADRLGFVNQGTTSVEVELILPEEIRQAEARGEVIRARGAEAGPALAVARMLSARLQGEERTSPSRNDAPIVSSSSQSRAKRWWRWSPSSRLRTNVVLRPRAIISSWALLPWPTMRIPSGGTPLRCCRKSICT
jgi:rare lipoprotein A (peptidoglycan hydrolase)